MALRLQHRYPDELIWRRADYIWGTFLGHWSRPIQETFPLIHGASQARLNLGETFNAAFCAFTESAWRFLSGEVLSFVAENIESQNDFVEKIDGARSIQRMLWQTVENLTSPVAGERAHTFDGPRFDDAKATIGAADSDKTSACIYHILRLYLSYLFGAYNEAVHHAVEAEKRVESIVSMPLVPFLKQFGALARIAAARARGDDLSIADAVRVRRAVGSFRKWAAFGPANYAHRLALLEAEMARRPARGSTHGFAALDLYERAISLARAAGSLADEALALELAAESAAGAGDKSVASALFDRAVFTYRKWGARSKADALVRSKSEYGLISPRETRDVGPKSEVSGAHGSLDMASLMKASAAMAEEIVMDRLLGRLIEILAENAGAESGALLFAGVHDLTLEAERGANGVVQVRRATPVAQADSVCESIVRYVARTQELLVLDDAVGDGRFRAIPYIQNRSVRSVLCMPIKHQGKFLGVLYLENNLVARAFTSERRQVLDLLAAQAAVSLENARVYETLEERVAARTKELRHSNDELASTLARLREAQQQLITQEKLASLGALTSGIAHEIKNPLNFVNNFSELSIELLDELLAGMEPDTKPPFQRTKLPIHWRIFVSTLGRFKNMAGGPMESSDRCWTMPALR
ncbi:MAG: GAF domain-containing protein [Polyangiaceae bacterium]|nr:GAF domain-containing protein [Polyangiaceae bacterium]